MRIYIDESGNFAPASSLTRVCCQAALVIPERFAAELLGKYAALRSSWTSELEIKGSSLTDEQTSKALNLMKGHGVVAEICAIDVAHHTIETVKAFQVGQARVFDAGLTPKHNVNARRFVAELNAALMSLPPQLVVQARVLIGLIEELLHYVPTFYAQRLPAELAKWDWFIDPKDTEPTVFEDVWTKAVAPLMQTLSLEKPGVHVDEFDYSGFDRFSMNAPDYLEAAVPDRSGARKGIDLQKLLTESRHFPDSRADAGLQLADIVASAFTKAMNGRLPEDVWRRLGPLLIQKPTGEPPVRFVVLGAGPQLKAEGHHKRVLLGLRAGATPMFVR